MGLKEISANFKNAMVGFAKAISNTLEYPLKIETVTIAAGTSKDYIIANLVSDLGIPAAELDMGTIEIVARVESTPGQYINSEGVLETYNNSTTISIKNCYTASLNVAVNITIKRKKFI